MISVNRIYAYVEAEVNTVERPVYVASRLEPLPPQFPSVQIVEINHRELRNALPLNFGAHDELSVTRDFEAHVFSNLKNGALTEARSIMTDVEVAFRKMYFIETYCGQANNDDPSVVHIVARFTRNFGDNDPLTIA